MDAYPGGYPTRSARTSIISQILTVKDGYSGIQGGRRGEKKVINVATYGYHSVEVKQVNNYAIPRLALI